MSQRSLSGGDQKGFAAGRGLLAAAETLNFNMNDQRSGRQLGGAASGGGMEGQDARVPMLRGAGGSQLGSTMKLFASLGLSPSDLDALAQLPDEDISVETLPQILMQLKSHKGDLVERRMASSMSSDASFRGSRGSWGDMQAGRVGGSSFCQGSGPADLGFLQDGASSHSGYGLNYGGGGRGSRERPFSELSRPDSYGRRGLGPPQSDLVFMRRTMGSPSHKKVQDFLGVMPSMFPHVCSLCDFDVHSTMRWNQHVNGLRHAENRRQLLNMYPDWDHPAMAPDRSGGFMNSPNMAAGLLGPAPLSGPTTATTSSWAGGLGDSGKNHLGPNQLRSRVVVVKYERKPLSNRTLFGFCEQFGYLREHLVLKNKAFLEMDTHEAAQEMVSFYQQHPASLYGKPITFYLSQRLLVIEKEAGAGDRLAEQPVREVKGHGSQVVFFSNLPREDEEKKELLVIAGRFGTVEKHLFLTDQAFVQLGAPEDAEMLVKHYTVNPLAIRGRRIRLNICTKYKTLNLNRRLSGTAHSRRGGANTPTPSSSRTREDENTPGAKEVGGDVWEDSSSMPEGAGQQADTGSAEGTEPEKPEPVKDPERGDVSGGPPAEVGGADSEQGAESEEHKESTETQTGEREKKDGDEYSDPGDDGDQSDQEDQDFLKNMEDFVTLDDLAKDDDHTEEDVGPTDASRTGGMRVVNVMGFRRGHNFLSELLALATPFGKVVKHLVLDLRPEAYLQFSSEEEALAMAKFYNSNVTASVCGRPVRVYHSMTYPTIQCGSSKVVYIGQIPNCKYSDGAILRLAEPFGKVAKYFVNRLRRECFIEMEEAADAEKMADNYKKNPQKFHGKRLTIYVSRKYRQLKHGHRCPAPKRQNSDTPPPNAGEPPSKKPREEQEETVVVEETQDKEIQKTEEIQQMGEEQERPLVTPTSHVKTQDDSKIPEDVMPRDRNTSASPNRLTDDAPHPEIEPRLASLPLPPFDPDRPIGVEHVKKGFYCCVCFLFYPDEDSAKKSHCSSRTHYDQLQKYLEKVCCEVEEKSAQKTA